MFPAGIAFFTSTPTATPAAGLLAVESGSTRIHRIDLATGAATLVGPVALADIAGIAFDASGTLYDGITSSPNEAVLYTLDPAGGTATLVNPTTIASLEGALTFDPVSGELFSKGGAPAAATDLIKIDPLLGLGMIVGPMGLGLDADVTGMDFLADGTLLAYDSQGALPSRLLSIDKVTGAATVIGDTGAASSLPDVGGLAVDPDSDVTYLSNGLALFSVDPGSGLATLIGSHLTPLPLSGLSFRPAACMIGLEIGNSDGVLWDIDPASGEGRNPRPLGGNGFGALARSPSGSLYAIRYMGGANFYEVDQGTGATTFIGPMGLADIEGGLDFHPSTGVLYGVNAEGGVTGVLFTVDLGSGAATVLGPILAAGGSVIDASALAFDASGELYLLRSDVSPMEIWRIDPSDASTLSIVPVPGLASSAVLAGMEFDDATGKLYVLFGSGGFLAEVDPITGVSTMIGPTVANAALEIVGPCGPPPPASPVPALSTATLMVLAAGLLTLGSLGVLPGPGHRRLRRPDRSS